MPKMKSAPSARELRKTMKETGLDRKNNSQNFEAKKVKASTLAMVVMGLREDERKRSGRLSANLTR